MGPGEPSPPSFPCYFIHSSAFSLFFIAEFGRFSHYPYLLPQPDQWSCPILSHPALGNWKRNPYSPCLEGFLPGPWEVDLQASRDVARASFSWTVGALL